MPPPDKETKDDPLNSSVAADCCHGPVVEKPSSRSSTKMDGPEKLVTEKVVDVTAPVRSNTETVISAKVPVRAMLVIRSDRFVPAPDKRMF